MRGAMVSVTAHIGRNIAADAVKKLRASRAGDHPPQVDPRLLWTNGWISEHDGRELELAGGATMMKLRIILTLASQLAIGVPGRGTTAFLS